MVRCTGDVDLAFPERWNVLRAGLTVFQLNVGNACFGGPERVEEVATTYGPEFEPGSRSSPLPSQLPEPPQNCLPALSPAPRYKV